jgi:hypothetical protein
MRCHDGDQAHVKAELTSVALIELEVWGAEKELRLEMFHQAQDRQHAAARFTKAIEPRFAPTVRKVFGDYAGGIQESALYERHAMLALVFGILGRIPRNAVLGGVIWD